MSTTRFQLAQDPAMPRVGDLLDERYRIGDLLGTGGFAAVFRAEDARTRQVVAVKVLDPMMSRRTDLAARFEREVAIVSRLRHHNTIKVMDTGRTPSGCLYLVMELLNGASLDAVLETEGPLSEARVHRITVQILKSLAEAHAHDIIHRDLKPANIFLVQMVGEVDYVKVLDFGIAKSVDQDSDNAVLTQTGEVVCSPHYVAPERTRGITKPSSDLYSLGILMIELLDGLVPYRGDTPVAIMIQHAGASPVPIRASVRAGALGRILERATAKHLDDRYTTAEEMLNDLLSITDPLRDTPLPRPSPEELVADATTPLRRSDLITTRPETSGATVPSSYVAPTPKRTGWYVGAAVLLLLLVAVVVVFRPTASTPDASVVVPNPALPVGAAPTPGATEGLPAQAAPDGTTAPAAAAAPAELPAGEAVPGANANPAVPAVPQTPAAEALPAVPATQETAPPTTPAEEAPRPDATEAAAEAARPNTRPAREERQVAPPPAVPEAPPTTPAPAPTEAPFTEPRRIRPIAPR